MLDLTEFGNSVPVTMAGLLHKDFQDKKVTGAVYYNKYQERGYLVAGLNQDDFKNIGITELDQVSELHSMDGRGSITLIRFENNRDVLGFVMSSEVRRIIETTPALQPLMDYEWGIYDLVDPQSEAPMAGDLKILQYADGSEVRIPYDDLTRWFEIVNEYGLAQVLGGRENWWALAKEYEEPQEEVEHDGYFGGGGSMDLDDDYEDEDDGFSIGGDDVVFEGEIVDGPRTPKNLDPRDVYRQQAQEDMQYEKDSHIESEETYAGPTRIETSGEVYVEGDPAHNIDNLVSEEEDDSSVDEEDVTEEAVVDEEEVVEEDDGFIDEADFFETDELLEEDDDISTVDVYGSGGVAPLFGDDDDYLWDDLDEDVDENVDEEIIDEEEIDDDAIDKDGVDNGASGGVLMEEDSDVVLSEEEKEKDNKGDDGTVSEEKHGTAMDDFLNQGENMTLETRRTLSEAEEFEQMLEEDALALAQEEEATRLAQEAEEEALREAEEEEFVYEDDSFDSEGEVYVDDEDDVVYDAEDEELVYPNSAAMVLDELLDKELSEEEREEIASVFLSDRSDIEAIISTIAVDDQELDQLSTFSRGRIVNTINRERNLLAQDIVELLIDAGHIAYVKTTPDKDGVDEDIQTRFDEEIVKYSEEAEGKIEEEKEAFEEELTEKYNEDFDAWWKKLSEDPKAHYDSLYKEEKLLTPVANFEDKLTQEVNETIADRVESLNKDVLERQHKAHRTFLLDHMRVWRRVASTSEQMLNASVSTALLTETVSSLQKQIDQGPSVAKPVEGVAPKAQEGPSQAQAERASAVLGGQEEETIEEEVEEEPTVELDESFVAKEAPVEEQEETEDEEIARLKEEIKDAPAEPSTGDLNLQRGGSAGLTPAEQAAQQEKEAEVPSDAFGADLSGASDDVFGGMGDDVFGGAGGDVFGGQSSSQAPQAPANDIFSQLSNQPVTDPMPQENPDAFGTESGGASGDVFADMASGVMDMEIPADAGRSNQSTPSQEVPAEEEEEKEKKGLFGRLGLGRKK